MNYEQFLEAVKAAAQEKLGNSRDIKVQKIKKNNGVILEGLVINSKDDQFAPTIYLDSYYLDFKHGRSLTRIIEDIITVCKEDKDMTLKDIRIFLDFNNLKDKVVYKLIQTEANEELLKDIPSYDFLDLSVVFYLILDENKNEQMTALIHNSHMDSWGTTKEELYQLARKNTPEILPARIKTMREVLKGILKENQWDMGDGMIDELLGGELHPMYVLSNERQVNGACCILYDDCLEKFATEQKADIIILPSSIHETLLIPEWEGASYEELSAMVTEINQSEVQETDRLSNQIYRYSHLSGSVEIVFQSEKCLVNRGGKG
ncbi:hypothetical protein LAD12857_19690 [Lacrimispora amygdalina]|uniref:Transcriptional regulator n=1 Tax=Lacrimispora amygdalina TaxID=253257 RepID=A0ABQ5M683_9FIRM